MNSTRNSSATKPNNGRMGSCNSHRKGVLLVDKDGNESFRSNPQLLEDCLIRISNQKAKSGKDEALSAIVGALTMEVKVDFVKKNFATLLYHCLFFVKKGKGSIRELVLLALQTVGLLVMIVEDEDSAHEIYQDSVPVLSQVLESGSKNKNDSLKILNCLSIVGFFGSYDTGELQEVMNIIWRFLEVSCSSDVKAVAAAAISAWSFLLSTMEAWHINQKDWQGALSFLLNILEHDDDESFCCVHVAAAEALALIFEINCIEKFSTEAKANTDSDSIKQILKDKITEKLRCEKAGIDDVLEFFEKGKFLKTNEKIGKDKVVLSAWCQRIQLNFMIRFLGEDGFVRHMRQNENLQAIFEFTPKKKNVTGNTAVVSPEREEVTVSFFIPKVERKDDGSLLPFTTKKAKETVDRVTGKGPNSSLNKFRTRLLNKKRMLSQGEKHQLHDELIDDS